MLTDKRVTSKIPKKKHFTYLRRISMDKGKGKTT